jgi:hypothetical protein
MQLPGWAVDQAMVDFPRLEEAPWCNVHKHAWEVAEQRSKAV